MENCFLCMQCLVLLKCLDFADCYKFHSNITKTNSQIIQVRKAWIHCLLSPLECHLGFLNVQGWVVTSKGSCCTWFIVIILVTSVCRLSVEELWVQHNCHGRTRGFSHKSWVKCCLLFPRKLCVFALQSLFSAARTLPVPENDIWFVVLVCDLLWQLWFLWHSTHRT